MRTISFQQVGLSIVARRAHRKTRNRDKLAAAALRYAHAHAEWRGDGIDLATLEQIMLAFGATRETQHA